MRVFTRDLEYETECLQRRGVTLTARKLLFNLGYFYLKFRYHLSITAALLFRLFSVSHQDILF